MEIKQIQYFLTLFDSRNLNKASQQLFISQQGLSKSIKALEMEVGSPLFIRTNSGMEPTPLAIQLHRYFQDTFQTYEHLLQAIKDSQSSSELSLVSCHGFAMSTDLVLFNEYSNQNPHLKINYWEVANEEVANVLKSKKAELGFMYEPISDGISSLVQIGQEPLMVIGRHEGFFQGKKEISVLDLKDQEIIYTSSLDNYHIQIIHKAISSDSKEAATATPLELVHRIYDSKILAIATKSLFRHMNFTDLSFLPLLSAEGVPYWINTHLVCVEGIFLTKLQHHYVDYQRKQHHGKVFL